VSTAAEASVGGEASGDTRRCAACGGAGLSPHLPVGGRAGPDGLIPTTDRFGTALADIVRCHTCGHMQLERMPGEAALSAAYGEAESLDYVEEEAGQRATARRVLDAIEGHTGRGDLLDLGCWVGFLLAEAGRRGWSTLGVEPSAFASAYARENLGLDVQTEDLFAADLGDRTFDAVFLGDVIEHLPDPGGALERIRPMLADGGVLAMALPDAGSRLARAMGARWWSVIPTHVHYFTRRSMRTLLERHGYEALAIGTSPKLFTVRYYLGRIGGYSPRLSRALVRGAEMAGLADRIWGPDLRDRMLVIARPRQTAANGRQDRAGRARFPAPSPS
jgi:SAM-dependent methyltransferase